MADLTFSDLQNEVYAHSGLDSTDTLNQTNVNRWINYSQQEICSRWPWSFLLGREDVMTVPDKTAGTVSLANGNSTVSGVGTAFTASDVGSFIQFSSANDWYKISPVLSSTVLGIDNLFPGTTLVNSKYVIRKFFYSLSATADEVMDVRNWNTPVKLVQCDFRTIDLINPLVQSSNAPYAYMMYGTDSSGNLVFMPYPFPTDARLFEFRVRSRPTDMSLTTDRPSIPNKFAHVIAWGAISVAFAYLRKFEEAEAWNAKVMQKIDLMKKDYRQAGDYQPVLGSIDSISRSRWIQFPTSYPSVGD